MYQVPLKLPARGGSDPSSVLHPRAIALLACAATAVASESGPALAVNGMCDGADYASVEHFGAPARNARGAPNADGLVGERCGSSSPRRIRRSSLAVASSDGGQAARTHSSTENLVFRGRDVLHAPSVGCGLGTSASPSTTSRDDFHALLRPGLVPQPASATPRTTAASTRRCSAHAFGSRHRSALTVDHMARRLRQAERGLGAASTGDLTYKVAQAGGGDPAFPAGTTDDQSQSRTAACSGTDVPPTPATWESRPHRATYPRPQQARRIEPCSGPRMTHDARTRSDTES